VIDLLIQASVVDQFYSNLARLFLLVIGGALVVVAVWLLVQRA
jgi:hypothetical protein